MSITGLLTWISDCSGQIVQGDGLVCIKNGGMTNLIVLAVIVGLIVYYIKKKKGKTPMQKNFGSFCR